jgi:hypothetical protein
VIQNVAGGMRRRARIALPVGRTDSMKSHAWYYRPSRLGMRKAEAARLAKKLNDAADDGRLVACLTMTGQLVIDADVVRELRARRCGHEE